MLRSNPAYRVARVSQRALPVVARYQLLDWSRRVPFIEPQPRLWRAAHEQAADAIADVADELGGMYVKFCQVAGTLADLSPAPFLEKLVRFQDRVEPRPFRALGSLADAAQCDADQGS